MEFLTMKRGEKIVKINENLKRKKLT